MNALRHGNIIRRNLTKKFLLNKLSKDIKILFNFKRNLKMQYIPLKFKHKKILEKEKE